MLRIARELERIGDYAATISRQAVSLETTPPKGAARDMVGFIPADVVVEERPQGRGYMRLEETAVHPWPATQDAEPAVIPAHEFHHARLVNIEPGAAFAYKVLRGAGIDGQHDALVVNNLVAGFAHHRNTTRNPWVGRFLSHVRGRA